MDLSSSRNICTSQRPFFASPDVDPAGIVDSKRQITAVATIPISITTLPTPGQPPQLPAEPFSVFHILTCGSPSRFEEPENLIHVWRLCDNMDCLGDSMSKSNFNYIGAMQVCFGMFASFALCSE